MTSVVIGMLLCIAAAVVILLVVALPKLREGAPLLTDEGEDAVRQARRRARALAARTRDPAPPAVQATEPDDDVADERDEPVAVQPGRRGTHRRASALGWGDPTPGPRHGRLGH